MGRKPEAQSHRVLWARPVGALVLAAHFCPGQHMLAGLGKESELKAALFWPFIVTELNSSSWLERQTKSCGQTFLVTALRASTSAPQGRCFGVPPTASCSHGNPSVFPAESKAHSRCVGFAAAKDFYNCFSHKCCAIS